MQNGRDISRDLSCEHTQVICVRVGERVSMYLCACLKCVSCKHNENLNLTASEMDGTSLGAPIISHHFQLNILPIDNKKTKY